MNFAIRFVLTTFLTILPAFPAFAQYAQGDACTVAGKVYTEDAPGKPSLFCDGANLQNFFIPKENGALACTAPAEGGLRYLSATDAWEFCNGASWVSLASGSGTPSAAGSDREIQFNSGGVFGANANFVWDQTNEYLGIGTASPTSNLTIHDNGSPAIHLRGASATYWLNPEIYGQRARGTIAAPTKVLPDDELLQLVGIGYDSNSYENAAYITFTADGTTGDGDMPGRIDFSTSPDGSVLPLVRMTVKSDGNVGIGTDNPNTKLHVASNTNNFAISKADKVAPWYFETRGPVSGDLDIHSGWAQFRIFSDTDNNDPSGVGAFEVLANGLPSGSPTSLFYVDQSGAVGIGTTTPGTPSSGGVDMLHISAASDTSLMVESKGTDGPALVLYHNPADGGRNYKLISTGSTNGGTGTGKLVFWDEGAGAVRMAIDSAGKVGIGTTTPGTPASGGLDMLHVSAASDTALMVESKGTAGPALVLYHNPADGGRNYKLISTGSTNGGTGTGKLVFWDEGAGAVRMAINSAGNVGIGTTSPQSTLHVPDGKYAQFEDNNAGAPPAGDCDADAERGRMTIDTTNNRLYICNGATRGWDYVALTN